jgi:hypothetical protein
MQNQLIALSQELSTQFHNIQSNSPGFAGFVEHNYLPDATQILQQMQTIGNVRAGLSVADGIWGPATQKALQNVIPLGSALLQLAHDFHLSVGAFDWKELAQLQALITENQDSNITQKIDAAIPITTQLKNLRELSQQVQADILHKPLYRSYVEGGQAFHTYHAPSTNASAEQVQQLAQQFNGRLVVNLEHSQPLPITVEDLSSLVNLQHWQQQHAPHTPLLKIVHSVQQQNASISPKQQSRWI